MIHAHPPRTNVVPAVLRSGLWASTMICVLVTLTSLFLPACGGGEPPDESALGEQAALQAERPKLEAAKSPREQRHKDDPMDPSTVRDREEERAMLVVADPLLPELAGALPPAFPDDIPLGNWLSISSVRQLSETDFVISCSTSRRRDAVGEFFVRQMPEQGWKLVNHSSKAILSVLTFRKGERAFTVMIKKQAMNQDVAFDLSYKAS